MAKMGITMIQMYSNMIIEKFAPLLSELKSREQETRNQVEIAVKKDLGIYNLYEDQARLKLELAEIERQLKGWEDRRRIDGGDYLSPIEERVGIVMRKSRNGIHQEVEKARDEMIYAIKLSGVDTDIKDVFKKLPGVIEKLSKKIDKLPAPDAKKLLK